MVGELTDLRERPPWRADRLAVPVVALYGELGAPHHRAAMEYLAEHLPDCRAEMIPGARHPGPNTHAELVAGAITPLFG